jgi:O-antigen/teichoic acid export membrane protein
MQFAWALPDSASIGLAQLNAEGNQERVTATVSALLRMHLLLAGGVICVVLAVNAGLVRVWIGPDLYGGTRLNGLFAVDVVALSVAHALCVPAAVLGRRLSVGIVTLANGVVHILLAIVLGGKFGLEGVAAATFLSALVTTIPLAAAFLRERTTLDSRALLALVAVWSVRVVPCAALAALTGWLCAQASLTGRLGPRAPLILGTAAATALGVVYLYSMRTIVRDLPFSAKLRRILGAFRLV